MNFNVLSCSKSSASGSDPGVAQVVNITEDSKEKSNQNVSQQIAYLVIITVVQINFNTVLQCC